ncbi:cholesterol 7-desaturase nvd 1 [Microplitis demolitor]|uniref:cholesterol 7-desaturase nvd 1 n=1 Tax=Microplitis demolitor TaxID=69319 RepID=UPI0004CCEE1A|nr:cholesterol 7-desaturase nvd 1 [Microplitis demolitor]
MISWLIGGITTIFLYILFFYKINYIKRLKNINQSRIYLSDREISELPPIYPNGWYALLESSELAKGQAKHVSALGENFAVFRTEKGNVNVIDAYCPHLGANLAKGGKVINDCLECPFHNWTFSGDGKCQSIPYSKTDPSKIKMKSWTCREVNKLIFVWYHAELADPEYEIESIPQIEDGSWQCHGRNEFHVTCHIQDLSENGADWAHLSVVHGPTKFMGMLPRSIVHHSWTGVGWQSNAPSDYNDEPDHNDNYQGILENGKVRVRNNKIKKHCGTINLHHKLLILNKFKILNLNVHGQQVGPGYVELFMDTALGPVCVIHVVVPLGPFLQRTIHLIYSSTLISPYTKMIFIGECAMFERDVEVWNYKKFIKNAKLVNEDRSIAVYRRWYKQFYTAHSPLYQSARSIEW